MTAAEIERRDRFDRTWSKPPGPFAFTSVVQHKSVGMRYMVTAFIFFLIGGVLAMLMRTQLAQPESNFVSAETYNELFTMHGTTMMFLFAIPFLEGLATYFLPLLIGARDMPFPRYNAFNYWCYLLGGIILYSSYLFDMVPTTGWFSYVPLSGPEFSDRSMDFWLFGLTLAEIAAVGAAIEIVVSVLRCRAPGMSLNRMPIFAWTMLSVGLLIIIAFVPLIVASVLLELDRTVGTAFFEQELGGSPLLWQHLFWIFGHPEVYVMFLPGAAIISHVIPVHARHPLVAYPLVVVAVIVTAVMSLGLWVHHMYTTGLPAAAMGFFTAASMSITLASGVQVFAWIATLWSGRPRLTAPMLWSIGFIVTFVAGGVTGVMVASVSFDSQVHDTYFVVAHFHYVIIGGMLFPLFAGLYHWWPKLTGRLYSEGPARLAFALIFVGFHLTFFPMHLAGLWGMPRRVYTYEETLGVDTVNLLSTIGSMIVGVGVVVLVVSLAVSLRRPVHEEAQNPWEGDSLEWTAQSPPASENFTRIPVIRSRHPGWDPPAREDPALSGPVRETFDGAPAAFRAGPLTTVLSGEPDAAMLLPRSTAWPMVPPLGLGTIAASLLSQWYPLAFVGIAVTIGGLAGWGWRNEAEYGHNHMRPLPGGLRIEEPGGRSIGLWGAAGAGVVILVAAVTLTFSGLYLQVNASAWPEGSTYQAPLGFAGVGALLLACAALAWWGSRTDRDARWDAEDVQVAARQRGALLAVIIAGLVAAIAAAVMWITSGLEQTAHAYDSTVWTMFGASCLALAFALGITLAAGWARLHHRRDLRPALQLQNASILWATVLVVWAMTWVVADVMPRMAI
ncbi:cytochrome c oxidase subunit I [Demequina sp. SO4-13]|uniref:cytochrome c oxidase subunit I n=1 Tax=Demequina sp. SO4-13 TaxID=3401027 RepID=UPI003AF66726